jgi:hypothetical protein
LVVSATLAPEADVAAFHEWYDYTHLPEITACPGFHEAVRYSAPDESGAERHFLAIYRIDGPEALDSAEFGARRGFGPFAEQVSFTTRVYARHDPAVRD